MANSALELQQTAESAPPASPHHPQDDAPPYSPDNLSPTLCCRTEFMVASYPSYPLEQDPAESTVGQAPNTPQNYAGLQQQSMDCEGGDPAQGTCNSPIVILVMGVTGCGKTSFIEKAIGHKNPGVAANIHGRFQCGGKTFRIDSFSAELDGKQYLFLDTTGSSTIEDNDPHETASLCEQLCNTPDINGILYIHRINADRMNICSMQYLSLFEAICGRSCMKNVLLLTNHWDRVKPEVGESREKELRDDFWKGMIDAGAKIERLNPTLPECVHTIVGWLGSCAPTVLAIKDEMVHQNKPYSDTSVWWLITARIIKSGAAIFPEIKYIEGLATTEQLRDEVYKLTIQCIKLKRELRDYKNRLEEVQTKSIWHRLGFGW